MVDYFSIELEKLMSGEIVFNISALQMEYMAKIITK